jgi:hypothetical protein
MPAPSKTLDFELELLSRWLECFSDLLNHRHPPPAAVPESDPPWVPFAGLAPTQFEIITQPAT